MTKKSLILIVCITTLCYIIFTGFLQLKKLDYINEFADIRHEEITGKLQPIESKQMYKLKPNEYIEVSMDGVHFEGHYWNYIRIKEY